MDQREMQSVNNSGGGGSGGGTLVVAVGVAVVEVVT